MPRVIELGRHSYRLFTGDFMMFRTRSTTENFYDVSRVTSCSRAAILHVVLLLVTISHPCAFAEHLMQPGREKNGRPQHQQQQHLTTASAGKTRSHGQLSTGSSHSVLGTVTDGEKDSDGMCELEINCQLVDGNTTQPVRLPFRGPRGPKGQQGQKGDRGEVGKSGAPGRPGEPAPVARGVAFFVGLKENLGPLANHADVVFDGVVTNVGGAYDTETGRFTAPINGTFQFNIVVAAQGRQRVCSSGCDGAQKRQSGDNRVGREYTILVYILQCYHSFTS